MDVETKIARLAQQYPNLTATELLRKYLGYYFDETSTEELWELQGIIEWYLRRRIEHLEQARKVCYERGTYLEQYLTGEMWATEEAAKQNLAPQAENAKTIVEMCHARY